MNQKTLRILEFDKIRQQLTDCATSDPGREKCRSLFPSTELEEIQKMQAETSDALSRLIRNSGFSCGTDVASGRSKGSDRRSGNALQRKHTGLGRR